MLIYVLGVYDSLQNNLVCSYEILKNIKQEKVLRVTLDNILNSATQLLNITKNANKKFNALTQVQNTWLLIKKAYIFLLIKSQFTYCLLIYMFCTKLSLRRINNIHELACTVYSKTTYLNFNDSQRMQIKNRFTRNALNFFWLRFINTWMASVLILWKLSLSSDKIPITSEISTHLNLKILEQRSLP